MKHIDHGKCVTLPDFEIEFVVRRRDFQNAGAELGIDGFVGDDRNLLARERTPGVLADQVGDIA